MILGTSARLRENEDCGIKLVSRYAIIVFKFNYITGSCRATTFLSVENLAVCNEIPIPSSQIVTENSNITSCIVQLDVVSLTGTGDWLSSLAHVQSSF